MSKKQELKRSIYMLLKHSNRGSFSTKATRKDMLLALGESLYASGIQLTHIQQLKAKHVVKVVEHWKKEGLSAGTLKNRMSNIRFAWEALNKIEKLPTNDQLAIAKRTYTPQFNRAHMNPDLSKVSNVNARVSLELQRVFGLRREESMKIKPFIADMGDTLQLLPSWCKGNRGRFVPIRTEEQRHWLEEAKKVANKRSYSLIPQGKNYLQQRYVYEAQLQKIELKNPHGLRHAYAQKRYKELTGWEAPINGGPKSKELSKEQKILDRQARLRISEELGHSREDISKNYLGR